MLDARTRRRVEGDFGEEQQGFRKGRGTADGMYVLRQVVETGSTGQSTWRKLLTHRDGDGDATVDGSTRSRSEDG